MLEGPGVIYGVCSGVRGSWSPGWCYEVLESSLESGVVLEGPRVISGVRSGVRRS